MQDARKEEKRKKIRNFLVLSILGLIVINLPLISAYILLANYGTFTLNPGEKYTLNIPFIGQSRFQNVCGTAEQTDGTPLEGINVTLKYASNSSILAQATSGKDGNFCVNLPNMTSSKKFDVYVQYDNTTLTLGSNDYKLNFGNYRVYNKSIDKYAVLAGDITNYDAEVEDGRFEIDLKYNETGKFTHSEEIFDYQKYTLNIDPAEVYSVPNSRLNVSWPINSSTKTGVYKFYIKTSFNAVEKTKDIYFNVTD